MGTAAVRNVDMGKTFFRTWNRLLIEKRSDWSGPGMILKAEHRWAALVGMVGNVDPPCCVVTFVCIDGGVFSSSCPLLLFCINQAGKLVDAASYLPAYIARGIM